MYMYKQKSQRVEHTEKTPAEIDSTSMGRFGSNSIITFTLSSSIRWYISIFQKPHRFPGN